MNIVTLSQKTIYGLKVRTKNAHELNSSTAKIGDLWQKFYTQLAQHLADSSSVYGVYTNYESDMNGSFDVIAGSDFLKKTDQPELQKITLQAGNYLVFKSSGEMPTAVISAWIQIWNYFSSNTATHKRTYTTDFELYKSPTEVEVHIAIQ